MKISDESSQFRIMYAGMEFCIDTTAKKKYQVSLMFPTGNNSGMQDENLSDKKYIARSDVAFVKQKFLSLVKEMEVKGFKYPIRTTKDIALAQHKSWMSSHGHRANMLNADFSLIGVGVIRNKSGYYCTQLFYG